MRKSQYQTPNGCQTSRGTTFVNCKPSQPVQLYALLAGLPTALCPGYQFFIFRLFRSFYLFHFIYLHVTHHSLLASSLRLHSSQSSHWFRSSAPTAQRLSTVSSKLALAKTVAAVAHERKAAMAILSPGAATGGWKLKGRAPPPKTPRSTEPSGIKWNQMESEYHKVTDKWCQMHNRNTTGIAASNAGVSMLFILHNLHQRTK
jgi:hypothetical protein